MIDSATNTIDVEAKSKENGRFFHRLHALDLLTGAEKAPGPKVIAANVGGAVDQYSAAIAWQEFGLGTVNLAAGNQPFKFAITGKNAASSGFTVSFDYIMLTAQ